MNRLVIVGNGYDIARGLKTDYKTFMEWLVADSLKKAFNAKNHTHNSNCITIINLNYDNFMIRI